MLHTVTFRTGVLAACGWLLACDAFALTLGRIRGAALIGRPLEISIPVSLDGNERETPCVDAELFYGEQKVGRAPSVRWEPGPNRDATIRIASGVPVDEPMVTVYLRVGCGQAMTRRYVMLSEPPPASEPGTMPGATRPAIVVPRSEPAEAARAAPVAPAAPACREAGAAVGTTPAAAAAPPRPATRAARPARQPAAAPARAPQSRLRLDPADLLVERDPTLRLSAEMSAAVNEPGRTAAAALWKALQRTPEEILQEGRRLDAIDREMQALRAQTRQNATAVTRLREQVESARAQRNQASFLSAALLALLAAAAVWLVWRWRRSVRAAEAGPWFEPPPAGAVDLPLEPEPTAPTPVGPTRSEPPAASPAQTQPLSRPHPAAWSPSEGGVEFHASQGGTVRMVGVQEVLDVHEKVEFFLSLGQPNQAVALLEGHVHDQVETSALPWMDLLDLYHSLGRRVEYERLRVEFIQRFSAQVPDFDHFDQPTSSLENYGRALSRIVALWPSRRVLSVIEESIFRKPGLPGAEPFSLEAYRELVLLYHIARDVAPPEDSPDSERRVPDFTATSVQPLNMSQLPAVAAADAAMRDGDSGAMSIDLPLDDGDRELLLIPPSSPRIGVDIDLDAGEAGPSLAPERPPLDFDTSLYDRMGPGKR
jgi:hypothetical protein